MTITITASPTPVLTDANGFAPVMTTLTGGGYVIVWQSFGRDGSDLGIFMQIYNASGAKVGGETQVNSVTGGAQSNPAVAALAGGGFAIVYQSANAANIGVNIQVYNAAGTPSFSGQPTPSATGGDEEAAVAGLSDGSFIVVWDNSNDVMAQRFQNGAPVGSSFVVNTTTSGQQVTPSVAALAGGGYVVTWNSGGQDGSNGGIYFELFDNAGNRLSNETRANVLAQGNQTAPVVTGLSGGGFAIAWQTDEGVNPAVWAQTYNAAGGTAGNQVQVAIPSTFNWYMQPSIAALSNGGFVVGWQSYDNFDNTGRSNEVMARTFDATGIPIAPAAVLDESTGNAAPSVTGVGSGYLATWSLFTTQPDIYASLVGTSRTGAVLSGAIELAVGDGADDVFQATANALNVGDFIDGQSGFDTLQLTGGGTFDFTGVQIAGLEEIVGSSGNDTVVFKGGLAPTLTLDSGAGSDTLVVSKNTDYSRLTLVGQWTIQVAEPAANQSTTISASDVVATLFDAKRQLLYIVHSTGDIERYDPYNNIFLTPINAISAASSVALSADGDHLVQPINNPTTGVLSGYRTVSLVDLTSHILPTTATASDLGLSDLAVLPTTSTYAAVSENGRYVLVQNAVDSGGDIRLYDTTTHSYVTPTVGQFGSFNSGMADIREDVGLVVDLAGFTSKLTVYDLALQPVQNLSAFANSAIGVAFNSPGNQLFIWDYNLDKIRVIDTHSWTEVGQISVGFDESSQGHGSHIGQMEVSADGRFLFLSEGSSYPNPSTIEVIDLSTRLSLTITGDAGANILSGAIGADTLSGGDGADVIEGGAGDDTLDGGLGVDTASYRFATAGVTVNLGLSSPQSTGGAGTDTLTAFENLIGSAFGDVLTGTAGANVLTGNAGDDILTGAGGADTFVFDAWNFGADVITDFSADDVLDLRGLKIPDLATLNRFVSQSGADVLITFPNQGVIRLQNVTLASLAVGNFLFNTSNAPVNAIGGAQADFLWGAGGADTLAGGGGPDELYGLAGADILRGGAGDDHLDGGAGLDTADYSDAMAGVTVSLAIAGPQNTGGSGFDALISIEKLIGSAFADTLTGDAGANGLSGGAGDDVLSGGGGGDTIDGGAGIDTVAYAGAPQGVTVRLAPDGPGQPGSGGTPGTALDVLTNIENITGSRFSDTFQGDSHVNILSGGAGNDFFGSTDNFDPVNQITGPGDIIFGGTGTDIFTDSDGRASTAVVRIHNLNGSWSVGNDTLWGVEILRYYDTSVRLAFAADADFDADGHSDLVFRRSDGQIASWTLNSSQITGGGNLLPVSSNFQYFGQGDFNNDGHGDIAFTNAAGQISLWNVDGTSVSASVLDGPGAGWALIASGDFDADGDTDLMYRNDARSVMVRTLTNGQVSQSTTIVNALLAGDDVLGTGDFDGDGKFELLVRNAFGNYIFLSTIANGTVFSNDFVGDPGAQWSFAGIGDFNGDGKSDILFQDNTGLYATWQLHGTTILQGGNIGNPGPAWTLVQVGDYNGDGKSDLMFRNANGQLATWQLNGGTIIGGGNVGNPGSDWGLLGQSLALRQPALVFRNTDDGSYATWVVDGTTVAAGGALGSANGFTLKALADFNGDGIRDMAFQAADGTVATWLTNGNQLTGGSALGSPGAAWSLVASGDFSGDGNSDLLFRNADGRYATWDVHLGSVIGGGDIGSANGFTVVGTGDLDGDGHDDILFRNDATGDLAAWMMNDTQIRFGANIGNPGGSWTVKAIGDINGDGTADILFQDANGLLAAWDMNGGSIIGGGNIGNAFGTWAFQELLDVNGDGRSDIIFKDASGTLAAWTLNNTTITGGGTIGNPGGSWSFMG